MSGSTQDNPIVQQIGKYFVESLLYTLLSFIGVAILAFPFAAGIFIDVSDQVLSGHIFLAVVGVSIFFGQMHATGDMKNEEEETAVESFLSVVVSVLYYNLIIFLAALCASVLHSSGLPALGTAAAMGIPIIDLHATENWGVGIAYTLIIGAEEVATLLNSIYNQNTLSRVIFGVINLVNGMREAFSSAFPNLLLQGNKRRGKKS